MADTTVLTADELINLLDGVWEYNQRGKITQVIFCGLDGQPIALGSCQIIYEAHELKIRTKPEEKEQSMVDYVRSFNVPIDDPKKVPEPLSLKELEGMSNA